MKVTFISPSAPRPIGGVRAIFEFAEGLVRRGVEVGVVHTTFRDDGVSSIDALDWYGEFDPRVEHHFVGPMPEADVVFGHHRYFGPEHGLPVILIQGKGILRPALEAGIFAAPCPKVCVARWLVDAALAAGRPSTELVHVPYGLDHGTFHRTRTWSRRSQHVAMCYSSHALKGAADGLAALEILRKRMPSLRASVFGTMEPVHDIPSWITYHRDPPQDVLVDRIYNDSQVFLCPSRQEGFGFPSIEAMASGCALVTTDNGGSRDFAEHGVTAQVVPAGDVAGLADSAASLLDQPTLAQAQVERGATFVRETFDWDRSAALLHEFLQTYVRTGSGESREVGACE